MAKLIKEPMTGELKEPMTGELKEPMTGEPNTARELINKENRKKLRDASLPKKFQSRPTIFISEWDVD